MLLAKEGLTLRFDDVTGGSLSNDWFPVDERLLQQFKIKASHPEKQRHIRINFYSSFSQGVLGTAVRLQQRNGYQKWVPAALETKRCKKNGQWARKLIQKPNFKFVTI